MFPQLLQKGITTLLSKNKRNEFVDNVKGTIKRIQDVGYNPTSFPRDIAQDYSTKAVQAGSILKDIARAVPRAVATVGVTASNKLFGTDTVMPTSTKLQKTIFGEKPIQTIGANIQDTQKTIEPVVGKKVAGVASAPLFIAGLALDLSGIGGAARNAVQKNLTKDVLQKLTTETADDVIKSTLMNELKLTAQQADKYVPAIKTADNTDSVLNAFGIKKVPGNIRMLDDIAKEENGTVISETLRKRGYTPNETDLLELKLAKTPDEVSSIMSRVPKSETVNTPKEYFERAITFLQDSAYKTKKLVKQPDYQKTGELNLYEKRSIMPNVIKGEVQQTAQKAEEVVKDIRKTIPSNIADQAKYLDDVESYGKYQHALEYNAKHGDNAAGVSSALAKKELERLDSLPYKDQLVEQSKKVTDFNRSVLNEARDSGLISKDAYDDMVETYKNYVPFNRVMKDVDTEFLNPGGVSDVVGSGIKARKGSDLQVKNTIENSIENALVLSNRAAKNRYNISIADDIRANPQIGEVISDNGFIKAKTTDRNVIPFMEDGKKKLIVFKDENIAEALSGANLQESGTSSAVIKTIGGLTRMYNNLLTRFNVGFLAANPIRDVQEMAVALDSLNLPKGAVSKTALSIPASQKEIFNHIYKGKKSADYNELIKLGGAQGGQSLSLKEVIDPITLKNKSLVNKVVNNIDNANEILENATRLSVFKQLKKSGVNKERAAYLANEATINYARKGTAGPLINSLYSFANVSLQANAKFLRAMKNPKTAAKVAGTVYGVSKGTTELNNLIDENWRDHVPEKTRDTNIIIGLGMDKDGKFSYAKIPVAQSLRPILIGANAVNGDTPKKSSVGEKILNSFFEMFNPIGGNLDNPLSMITPTIARPAVDTMQNKAWTGYNITPDTFGKDVAPSENYFNNLGDTTLGKGAIKATEVLADKGIEISPANLEYLVKQYTGGVGKTVLDSVDSLVNLIKKEPVQGNQVPVVSRFFGQSDPEKVNQYKGETRDLKKMQREQDTQSAVDSRDIKNFAKDLQKYKKDNTSMSKEELSARFKELEQRVPNFTTKLDSALGKNTQDKVSSQLMKLNVTNGKRAEGIMLHLDSLPKEERAAAVTKLKKEKVITDSVEKQLIELIKNKKTVD